jgi:hypothetical protein
MNSIAFVTKSRGKINREITIIFSGKNYNSNDNIFKNQKYHLNNNIQEIDDIIVVNFISNKI